jgi:hypothetical protein
MAEERTMTRGGRRIALAASFAAAVAVMGAQARALVGPGAIRPAGRVHDADDHTLDLRAINGKPILVLYEDKDSAKVNELLKADLSRLAKGDRYRSAVALVPVADVQSFDFWPVRGFVKDAIRSESKKQGATIYCDWDGNLQRAAGFKRGTSSVMLIGRDARVLFAHEGAVPADQRERLIALLRSEVEAGSAD